MIVFPNAKINIGLNITEKRADGYHTIETVFYPVPVYDVLEVIENKGKEIGVIFESSGISIPGNTTENLCVKAYKLLEKDYKLPSIKIHLHKTIPIGAGLGGGSSDAAFFIKLMNDKFFLGLSDEKMITYASQLGSDCAFFISNTPCFATGKGEVLEKIGCSLKGIWMVLVYPSVHISTTDAYAGVISANPATSLKSWISAPMRNWKNTIKNDFEETVFEKYPKVKSVKNKLYELGAVYASMSGSGSAVYGLFEKKPVITGEFADRKIWIKELS